MPIELFIAIFAMGLIVVLLSSLLKLTPAKTEPIRFRSMDTSSAIREVVGYTNGLTNSKFGFPSGVFVEDKVEDDRAVFKEVVFGTVGFQAFKYLLLSPFKVPQRMYRALNGRFKEKLYLNVFLFTVSAFLFAFFLLISIFLIYVTVIEVVTKKVLRSKIEARATVDPQNPDDVLVEFTLSGISARLTKAAITKAFVTPERPNLLVKA